MEALGLNLADWFILIVLIASGIISFARGFTKEFLSLFLWLAAFIAAISLEYLATPKINEFIGNEEISKIISYIVVFLIFIFIGGMIIKFISKLNSPLIKIIITPIRHEINPITFLKVIFSLKKILEIKIIKIGDDV